MERERLVSPTSSACGRLCVSVCICACVCVCVRVSACVCVCAFVRVYARLCVCVMRWERYWIPRYAVALCVPFHFILTATL